jgi:hypothetical protein
MLRNDFFPSDPIRPLRLDGLSLLGESLCASGIVKPGSCEDRLRPSKLGVFFSFCWLEGLVDSYLMSISIVHTLPEALITHAGVFFREKKPEILLLASTVRRSRLMVDEWYCLNQSLSAP